MIEVNAAQAVPLLCDHMQSESSVGLRWAIGRALRFCSAPTEVDDRITEMAGSSEAKTRIAAYRIAGWRSSVLDHELRAARDNEKDLVARYAAVQALDRRQREEWAKELIESCPSAPAPERWGTVAAIVALADPHVAWRRGDNLDIGQAIGQKDFALWDFAEDLKKKRVKELKDGADR